MTDWLKSVVLVTSDRRPGEHGTAFVIRAVAADGGGGPTTVVTCAHVVRSLLAIAADASAVGVPGIKVGRHPGEIVQDLTDRGIDLAVIEVAQLDGVRACAWSRGAPGEAVEIVGFEAGRPGAVAFRLSGKLAEPALTAIRGQNRDAWRLELDAGRILPGHSGSPVFRVASNRVVAVVAMGSDRPDGRDGVAVAIENLVAWPGMPPAAPADDTGGGEPRRGEEGHGERIQGRVTLRGVPKGSNVILDFSQAVGDDLQDITVTITRGSIVLTLDGPRDRVLTVCEQVLVRRDHELFADNLLAVEYLDGLTWRVLYRAEPLAGDGWTPRHRTDPGIGAGPPDHELRGGPAAAAGPSRLLLASLVVAIAIVAVVVGIRFWPASTTPPHAADGGALTVDAGRDAAIVDAAPATSVDGRQADAVRTADAGLDARPRSRPGAPCIKAAGPYCVHCVLKLPGRYVGAGERVGKLVCPSMRGGAKFLVEAELRVDKLEQVGPDCEPIPWWGFTLGSGRQAASIEAQLRTGATQVAKTTLTMRADGNLEVPLTMGACDVCKLPTRCLVNGTITVTER